MEERRKARRCAAALFIRFHDEDAPDINYGSFTQDVSVDGVRLLSPYRLKTDTTLKMRIDVPENPDLTVAEGSVRWVGKSPVTDENGDQVFSMGVEFTYIDRADRPYLAQLAQA